MITLNFYEANKAYGCLSNFSKHPITIGGRTWATSEHFFQAAKFTEPSDIEAIHGAQTPFVAARLGRERGRSLRLDWNDVRNNLMLVALRAKFTQHTKLSSILASTNGTRLVEHTANDRYWGDGGDGSGANMLGKLLEQVRSELSIPTATFIAPPWVNHPGIEPANVFWQTGGGKDDLAAAKRFRMDLPPEALAEYDSYFAPPAAWEKSWVQFSTVLISDTRRRQQSHSPARKPGIS